MQGEQRIRRCQGRDCRLIRPCLPFQVGGDTRWLCVDCCPIEVPSAAGTADSAVAADGGDAVHGE